MRSQLYSICSYPTAQQNITGIRRLRREIAFFTRWFPRDIHVQTTGRLPLHTILSILDRLIIVDRPNTPPLISNQICLSLFQVTCPESPISACHDHIPVNSSCSADTSGGETGAGGGGEDRRSASPGGKRDMEKAKEESKGATKNNLKQQLERLEKVGPPMNPIEAHQGCVGWI